MFSNRRSSRVFQCGYYALDTPLGPLKKIYSNSGPIGRFVRELLLRYRFRHETYSKQFITCFQIRDSTKAPIVDVLPWVHFLAKAPPPRKRQENQGQDRSAFAEI